MTNRNCFASRRDPFSRGPRGDEIIDKVFHGLLHEQVRGSLRYLEAAVILKKVHKHRDRAEAVRASIIPMRPSRKWW